MKEQFYPELDEIAYRDTLPNGLQICVVPRKGFARTTAYLVTDFGSIHTEFLLDGQKHSIPAGTAHFLEHKMFELPDGRDVSAEFAALGASVNAFTSYDMTAYYFVCTRQFDAALRLLLEFVTTPCYSQESIEREFGIIDQEIDMNLDSPDSMVFDNLMAAMYRVHPVRVPILGTSETIRNITAETLELCHRAFYCPGNLLLCVIGDVDPEAVKNTALQVLGTDFRPAGQKIRNWEESMTVPTPKVLCRMEVAMPTFTLAFKCESIGTGETAIRAEMTADLVSEALFGESSALYLELYEKGLIDSSFGGGFETLDGCAMLTVSGDSNAPEKVRDAIIARAAQLAEQGIPEADFLRLKRSAFGRRIRGLDSFDGTCFRICAYHFSDFDYFRFPDIYRQIQPEELTEFLRRVVIRERCSVSVIYPR